MGFIDVRSDTVTQPTKAMRDAMYVAEVGDDVYGDDPTINKLEKLGAEIFHKEAALFVPSGTMGNQLAIMTHTRRGDEVIASDEAHILFHEVGAAAVLSNVTIRQISFENGLYNAAQIERAIRSEDIHEPPTSLICIENALSNGRVLPKKAMEEIYAMAKSHGLPVHLDGARIFNAAVALNEDVSALAACADSISCCLSKGLCAPVGSLLIGERGFIARAKKNRKLLGGGMRQAGLLAAAGILALTEMPKRLHVDHENAKYLAGLLQKMNCVQLDMSSVEINMVWLRVNKPMEILESVPEKMLQQGIKMNGMLEGMFRFVTNNDVSREDVEKVAKCFREALGE